MPAPISWTGTPTVSSLWASFPGGVGAPNVPIPLSGGRRRATRKSKTHRRRRASRKAHRAPRRR